MELDLDELRATYDHPSDKSVIEVIDRLEQVTQERDKFRDAYSLQAQELEQAEQELAGYKTCEALSVPIDFESLERAIKAEQVVERVRNEAQRLVDCYEPAGENFLSILDGEPND